MWGVLQRGSQASQTSPPHASPLGQFRKPIYPPGSTMIRAIAPNSDSETYSKLKESLGTTGQGLFWQDIFVDF